MSHRYSWNDSRGSAVVWIGTVFVALAILGVSVYVAVTRTPPADIPPPQQVYTPPVEAPEPEVILPPAEEIAEPAPQVREAPEAEALPAREPEPESVIEAEPEGPAILQLDNLAGTIKLAVPFLSVRNKMPLEHTCYRNNMSPALRWGSAPEATQSYVVFLEKREEGDEEGDAFVNWIVFDLPAEQAGLAGAQSKTLPVPARHASNDHNNAEYIGPCEPKGRFTYALRVFALDRTLGLENGVDKDTLIRAMNGHIIDAAEQVFIHYKTY